MPQDKRATIVRLITHHAAPLTVIGYATTPPGDADYERRLRLWAADCAARALPLLAQRQQDDSEAVAAITAARHYAYGLIDAAQLMPFDCPPDSKLNQDAIQSDYSVASEVRLAAAMTAQADVWYGALAAAQHARSAILNAIWGQANISHRQAAKESHDESKWQALRLGRWLADIEPAEWPVSEAA
jgi:hypothetical protein